MNSNYTDITILLDKSGSMGSRTQDTLGGVNAFIAEQVKAPGDCTLSIIQFSDTYEPTVNASDIKMVKPLTGETYVADGPSTALVDSACKMIDALGKRLAAMPEDQRPGKVICVIVTDGLENASHEFKKADLKAKIERQEKQYNWQFIYLGANQDAIKEGESYGISAGKSLTYAFSGKGVSDSYKSLSNTVVRMRSCGDLEAVRSIDFTAEDRKLQEEELKK